MPPSFLDLNLQIKEDLLFDFVRTHGTFQGLEKPSVWPCPGASLQSTRSKEASVQGQAPVSVELHAWRLLVLNSLALEFGRNVCSLHMKLSLASGTILIKLIISRRNT